MRLWHLLVAPTPFYWGFFTFYFYLWFCTWLVLFSCVVQGKERLDRPVHLEVSAASAQAISAVEAAGGSVTCAHFNRLALRALLKPYKFDVLPRRARPAPKQVAYYMDRTKAGYLSPEVQVRNLKLFGCVTSEAAMRKEHGQYMQTKWTIAREKREAMGVFMPTTVLLD